MLYIRDDDLKLAFTTMINKLVYCHKLVLKPYLKALQENTGDASLLNIQQLEMLLEQNTEQRETLHKLMGFFLPRKTMSFSPRLANIGTKLSS